MTLLPLSLPLLLLLSLLLPLLLPLLGETALHRCVSKYDRIDVIRLLLSYKVDTSIKDNNGDTVLMIAKRNGYDYIVQLIEPNKTINNIIIFITIIVVLIAIFFTFLK